MLIETTKEEFRKQFEKDPSPFTSEGFLNLVEWKTDKIVRLVKEDDPSLGIIMGLKDGIFKSPFSAPFGGFHYCHEHVFYHTVIDFLSALKEYVVVSGGKGVVITLPPDIYQTNMNAKFVNAFIRLGFTMHTPELTNWVELKSFDGIWIKNAVAQNCRKALKNKLTCSLGNDRASMEAAFGVILCNRKEQGRKVHMSLQEILDVNTVFPVDFFVVQQPDGHAVGAGICYRGHEKVIQAIFMGDDLEKRNWGIMDLLYKYFYDFYKSLDYKYIDLGISSLCGEANIGLLRYKEIHNCKTSLRYTFSWIPE